MIASAITVKNSTKTTVEINVKVAPSVSTIDAKRKSASIRKAERPNYRLRLL